METNKYIELAKKLKALADRGIGGEKTNAADMLFKLMKKHGINIDEIESDSENAYFFKVPKVYFQLWFQIVKTTRRSISAFGRFSRATIKTHHLTGDHRIDCTATEYIEIEAKFDFYKKLFDSEYRIFQTAFFHANGLLSENTNEDEEPTEKELREWLKVERMANGIDKGNFRKQLGERN